MSHQDIRRWDHSSALAWYGDDGLWDEEVFSADGSRHRTERSGASRIDFERAADDSLASAHLVHCHPLSRRFHEQILRSATV